MLLTRRSGRLVCVLRQRWLDRDGKENRASLLGGDALIFLVCFDDEGHAPTLVNVVPLWIEFHDRFRYSRTSLSVDLTPIPNLYD